MKYHLIIFRCVILNQASCQVEGSATKVIDQVKRGKHVTSSQTAKARLVFTQFRQAFTETHYHFVKYRERGEPPNPDTRHARLKLGCHNTSSQAYDHTAYGNGTSKCKTCVLTDIYMASLWCRPSAIYQLFVLCSIWCGTT